MSSGTPQGRPGTPYIRGVEETGPDPGQYTVQNENLKKRQYNIHIYRTSTMDLDSKDLDQTADSD